MYDVLHCFFAAISRDLPSLPQAHEIKINDFVVDKKKRKQPSTWLISLPFNWRLKTQIISLKYLLDYWYYLELASFFKSGQTNSRACKESCVTLHAMIKIQCSKQLYPNKLFHVCQCFAQLLYELRWLGYEWGAIPLPQHHSF